MKWLFYKIRDKQFPKMGSWWVLVINNSKRLVKYNEFKSKNLVTAYFKGKKKQAKGINAEHLNWEEFVMLKMLEFRLGRKTVVDDIKIISDTMINPMIGFFLGGRIPLVNQVGGYRFLNKAVEVLEELEKDKIIWPEDGRLGINIARWPEGKHYYAKVGQYDVKDDENNLKWNTAREAEKWAKKFKKEILQRK